jgi:hypothetical protein
MTILLFNLDLLPGRHVDASSLRFTTSSTASWKNARRRLLSPHTLLVKGESMRGIRSGGVLGDGREYVFL